MPSQIDSNEIFRRNIMRHGLSAEDIDAIIRNYNLLQSSEGDTSALRSMAKSIITEKEIPLDNRRLIKLIHQLDSLLDIGINPESSVSKLAKAFHIFKIIFSTCLFLFTIYMLVGGLAITYPSTWPLHLLGFLSLLFFLAVFEGLQISVGLLRMLDVDSVKDEFPNAASSHAVFRTAEETRKFFAGRQLIVVVIVFFAAQLTAIPTPSNFPILGFPIPDLFKIIVGRLFWDLGIAGALITLWFGQLPAQFIANLIPIRFLNIRGMYYALKFAITLDNLGFTTAGTWFSDLLVKREERVPPSTREAYRSYSELYGFVVVGIKKNWYISGNSANVNYQTTAKIDRLGLNTITDDGLILSQRTGYLPTFDGYIICPDCKKRSIIYNANTPEQFEDSVQFQQTVAPQYGGFQPGETLVLETNVQLTDINRHDVIAINKPTKYVIFRIIFSPKPIELGRVVVCRYVMDPIIGEYVSRGEIELQMLDSEDPTFEFTEIYPPLNSQYILHWTYRHDLQ